jgi:hypothetical protein
MSGNSHQRRALTRAIVALLEKRAVIVPPGQDKKPSIWFLVGLFVGLIAVGLPLVGVNLNIWLGGLILLGAIACIIRAFWIWEYVLRFHVALRLSTIIAAVLIYLGLVGKQMYGEFKREHPQVVQRISHDPPFVAPKGPGIRVEMSAPLPSSEMCIALSEEAELQCLCPNPVTFSLKSLAAPNDNNYATEVTITAVQDPMYRVRLFARSQIHPSGELRASPYGKGKAALFTGILAYDLYSIILRSSSPEQEFKLELHSAEGLRIKCVNQEN